MSMGTYTELVEDLHNYQYVQYLNQSKTTKPKKPKPILKKRLEKSDIKIIKNDSLDLRKSKLVSPNSGFDFTFEEETMVQTTRRSSHVESKESLLITKQENDLIASLLGEKCRSLSTSVIQLFQTSPPDHSCWIIRDTGVLCVVKDNSRRAYFFRIYCPIRKQLLWQQEMYNNLEYYNPKPLLHTFEGEDGMVAFNFANEEEAANCHSIVTDLIVNRQRKGKRNRNSMQSGRSHSTTNIQQKYSSSSSGGSQWGNASNGNLYPNGSNGNLPQHQRSNSAGGQLKTPSKQSISKKRTRNLTTRDISAPSDFKHVSHVGWDARHGFNMVDVSDENLRKFFAEAGVSDKQLTDMDTRKFIYDFLEKNGGMEAIKDTLHNDRTDYPTPPPAVPPRVMPQQRMAPAPPSRVARHPSTSSRAAPSLPSKPPPPQPTQSAPSVPPPPPPIPSSASIPPPPPPPPPMGGLFNPPNPPVFNESKPNIPPPPPAALPVVPDTRSALLDSIKSGIKLKHVDPERKPAPVGCNDARSDLLSEIRQGVELKAVVTNASKPAPAAGAHGLAGALARALAERSRVIHSDSDTSDSSSEDEWGEE